MKIVVEIEDFGTHDRQRPHHSLVTTVSGQYARGPDGVERKTIDGGETIRDSESLNESLDQAIAWLMKLRVQFSRREAEYGPKWYP